MSLSIVNFELNAPSCDYKLSGCPSPGATWPLTLATLPWSRARLRLAGSRWVTKRRIRPAVGFIVMDAQLASLVSNQVRCICLGPGSVTAGHECLARLPTAKALSHIEAMPHLEFLRKSSASLPLMYKLHLSHKASRRGTARKLSLDEHPLMMALWAAHCCHVNVARRALPPASISRQTMLLYRHVIGAAMMRVLIAS